MSMQIASAQAADGGIRAVYGKLAKALGGVSWDILAIPMRAAAFSVFFRSGRVKIADWGSTVDLFRSEYRVPVLPPDLAASLATTVELGCSTLLLLGLATRFAALAVLGMIAIIQVFVYPSAWPDHIQWFAFLFPLLLRGAGKYSLDGVIAPGNRKNDSVAN
jgi:putative oxidoreductase